MVCFLDTNVLVYAVDQTYESKFARAKELLMQVRDDGLAILSSQVLGEFFVAVTKAKKGRRLLDHVVAQEFVSEFAKLPTISVDGSLVLAAMKRMERSRLSYWDALIVEAALRGGATVLYSEDMQHGQTFDGLHVENPFLGLANVAE